MKNEIRRQHGDGIFIEGWALYGEEMLMRTGLYPLNSASQGQMLRAVPLSRGAHRRGCESANRTWTFEQAVNYFMEAGGLDREAAKAKPPAPRRVRRRRLPISLASGRSCDCWASIATSKGKDFRLGQFHDDLIKNGSLPLSIVEWILLDDRSSLDQALK